MSLSTWLRTLAAGSPRKTIRRIRREEASPRSRLKLLLELLEDRLAPAVLHWTGAAADTTAFVPGGLSGLYFQGTSATGPNVTLNPANTNSIFNTSPPTITVLTPFIDFPTIGSNGNSFTLRGAATPLANFKTAANPNSSNVGALFEGQIYLSHLGNYTFGTASDDGSMLWLDSTDPNSSTPLAGSVAVVKNDANQGRTLKTGTYANTTIGLHTIIVGYFNGGGGASMTAFWSPTGGTISDNTSQVIPSSVLYHNAPASSWSNVGNWAEAAAPANGDTVVFDSSTANYKPSTASVNDIPNLTLNGIVTNNPAGATQDPAQIIQGLAVTITNTTTTLTNGITATSVGTGGDGPQTTISFAKITLGGDTVITNKSPAPQSTTPTLDIISNIDLAGHTLTSGKGTGSTADTGLTKIDGIISSSVPATDKVVVNSSGFLALTGVNTFDTAAQVTQGILVDAGTQSLGAVGATVGGATAALGISGGDAGTYSTGVTLTTGSSIIKVDGTGPTESFPIILTGNATIADGVGAARATGNPTFNGTINLGANTLTIDINAGAGVVGAPVPAMFFNGAITGVAGANLTKVGVGRAKLQVDSPNLVAAINVNGGFLSVASNKALGAGGNAVTVANGASLAFQSGITTPAAQGVTITGSGVGGHGAIYAWDSNNTFAGPITVSSGDLFAGGQGGNVTFSAPITLGTDNLQLVGTGGNNITITGAITGAASSTITKSDPGGDTIATNNKATFLGTTTINAGRLIITADGALGNGAITEAGGSLALSGGITYTGPLSLSGAGNNGEGAVESLSGTNTITGAITQSAAGSLGAASGATLVLPSAINNSTFDLTLSGNAGTTNVTGVISGSGGLIKNGTGTANLNAIMTYTGPTTINGGVLALVNPAAINAGGAITINGGSLGLPDGANITKGVTLNGGAIEALTGNVNSTVTGNITLSANSFLKSDAGTLTVNGNINLAGFTLTGEGAGNIVVNGLISGNTTNTPTAGLKGSYYATSALPAGTGDFLLDPNNVGYIGNLAPTFTDTTAQINFTDVANLGFAPDDAAIKGSNVAAHFVGSIMVDTAGVIGFESASDDGSVVFIDGNRVVNNPGGHGAPGPTPTGSALLSAGLHSIEVIYYQGGGGASEVLSWDPTNTNTFVVVPADHLFVASTNAVDKNGSGIMTLNNAGNSYIGGTNIAAGQLVAGNSTALNPAGAPVVIDGGSLALPAAGGVTLPANQAIVLNGGTIENLGGLNTIASPLSLAIPSSITSDAGTLTLNGNIQQNTSNLTFTGAGNTVVNGIIQSGATAPGLLESQLAANIDTTTPVGNPAYGTTIQLSPFMAETSGNDHAIVATALHTWATNDEWIYTGQMFWPNYNNTGIGYLSFAKAIDDDTSVKVDGVSYLFDTNWQGTQGTGEIALPTGFHNVDFRFSNGGGGAGADAQNLNGWTGFTNTEGFVYRVDAGPTDPLGDTTANGNVANYAIPKDPGDGSLFRQQLPSVIQNGTGTTTFNAANTYGGQTSVTQGTLVMGNVAALGAADGTFGTGTSVNGGSLALQGNITFPAQEVLTLAGTGANGAGSLENLSGNNIVNQTIDLPADGTIGSTAGTLTLNGNITSTTGSPNLTFTGAGKTIVNGQITGGTQILNVTGNYYSNLNGANVGGAILDPNNSNWIGNYSPILTAALTTPIAFVNTGVGGTGFPPYTTLSQSNIGALWTGTINIPQGTPISFLTGSDDGSRMWIDGTGPFNTTGAKLVVDNFFDQGTTFRSGGPFTLTPGLHNIAVAYYNGVGGGSMFAEWDLTGTTAAGTAAGSAGKAIPVATPGVVSLTKTGSGTVTLAAASNSYNGNTTVNGGVLQANGDVSLGANPATTISLGAGTLEIMTGTSYTSTHPLTLTDPAATLQVDGAAETITIPKVVSGTGTLNKTGPGTIVLSGSNPFTGGTVVTAGAVNITGAGSLGSGPLTMAGGTTSINVANPAKEVPLASATGWTRDAIWANSEASPALGTTPGLDNTASSAYVLYEQGSLFSPAGTGLPHNGVITSGTSGISYQLQSYTKANDLRIPGPGNSGTLTLAPASASNPNQFKSLSFLDLSANGGDSTYSATVNFADGTSTAFTGLVAPDMAGNSPPAVTGLSRIKGDGTASYDTASHGQLFDQTITLSAGDSVKVVKSILFAETASTTTNPAKLNIFGLSGLENFTTLQLGNSAAVTGNATLDIQTNAATIGPLTLGGNTLTVTGTVPVTFSSTTLTGNPTVAPATGQTINLGNVGGAGFLNTTGPGTTNVGVVGTGVTLGGTGPIGTLAEIGVGGSVNPGSAAGQVGTLTTTGGITFDAGSTNNVELGATGNDQISSGGTITLGNAVLNVTAVGGFTVGPNQTFTIIKNTGGNAIVGTFLGLPEGAGVSVGGKALQISYVGNGGHDVVLISKVNGPATHLSASATQTNVNAGDPVGILVTALDSNNLPAAAFGDTLHFTSTDPAATLPADSTISNSSGTFNVTFHTANTTSGWTVTVTDLTNGAVAGSTTAAVTVKPVILPAVNFSVTGPSNSAPGSQITLLVTARDANNNSTTNYGGTVHISSDTAGATLPADAKLTNGVGSFTVTLPAVAPASGVVTLTATDTLSAGLNGSHAVVIGTPTGGGGALTLSAPAASATNSSFPVTVTAKNSDGSTNTTYTGTVTLTSSDPLAGSLGSHTFTAADKGVFTFPNVTLKSNGNVTIQARDLASTNPVLIAFATIAETGLAPTITATPTGFKIAFNEAVVPKFVTLYGGPGAVADVTLTGAAAGALPGTLVFSADNKSATFNVTGSFLAAANAGATASLPNDTYTVTLVSATAPNGNGFQDVNGLGLDSGGGAHGDFNGSFTTTFAASPMLGVLDFARGPNASGDTTTLVKVPNNPANGGHVGIPVTLYNAAAVKTAGFTVTYNSQILTITGGISDPSNAGASFTMTGTPVLQADNIHSVATFAFTNATALSGTQILGDITAFVPNSAKTLYQVKDLVSLGAITVTGGGTVLAGTGVDANAYFGAVDGTHSITGVDKGLIDAVAKTVASGFPAFRLLDPAIIGDLANDNSVTGNSTSLITKFLKPLPVAEIPTPASIPNAQFTSPDSSDPIVSLPGAISSTSNGVVSVPVLLDHPVPQGSTGLTEAQLALTYDPAVLSLSSADITLGTIPGSGTGWTITSVVDQATGQIGIELFSLTPITSAQAGSLVNIAFHVVPGAQAAATGVRLVDSVTPNGRSFGTVLADSQAAMILSPGLNRLDVMTGLVPQIVASVTTSSEVTAVTGQVTVDGLTTGIRDAVEATYLTAIVDQGEAAPLAVLSNGSVVGEGSAHAVPANVVVTGALAFQTTAVAATQLAGQAFQVGNTGWLSSILATNNPQQLADRLFLALARLSDTPVDLSTLPEASLKSLTWDAAPQATWLADNSDATVADTQTSAQDQQTAAIADHVAALDRIFADLGNQTDELGDLENN